MFIQHKIANPVYIKVVHFCLDKEWSLLQITNWRELIKHHATHVDSPFVYA
jgi:hypothetical protein